MASRPQITHEQIVAYLHGQSEKEQREHLLEIKESDPVFQLFFDLVDRLKSQAIIRERPAAAAASWTFVEMEEMLMRLFGDALQPAEAQRLIDGLMFSPDFYRRLLLKLKAATPQIVLDEAPELAQIRIKPDEEILVEIMAHVKGRRTAAVLEDEPARQPQRHIFENLRAWFEPLLQLPRYAWMLLLVFAGSTATWLVYENFIKGEPFEYYVYDDRVPYEYEESSLRAPATSAGDPRFQAFLNQFMLGMSDYMIRDYVSAIALFEQAEAAMPTFADSASTQWQRDLNFYWGLSHLAFSIDSKLTLEDRAKQQQAAIKRLGRAEALVRERQLENSDRETYFLGLAYGLGGRQDSAVAQLQQIESESRFYKDSAKLIHQWSR